MTPKTMPLDKRAVGQIARDLADRAPGYLPGWRRPSIGPDVALLQITARFIRTLTQRLNRAPDKAALAFLDTLGIDVIAPSSARAPLTIALHAGAAPAELPAGSQFGAAPPPGASGRIVFETELSIELTSAKLLAVDSIWPGRDQYIDHSRTFAARAPFTPFEMGSLVLAPHALYISHDTLLAFTGESTVTLEFNFATPGSQPIPLTWEYWDGSIWRTFNGMPALAPLDDGTNGFTHSDHVTLHSSAATNVMTSVNGISSFWVRARTSGPLLRTAGVTFPTIDRIQITTTVNRQATSIRPDKAAFDGQALDVSKSFFPFGSQPTPGSTFYFASDEAFGKPGATVEIQLESASPVTVFKSPPRTTAKIAWEYWDGEQWSKLSLTSPVTAHVFVVGASISFLVPDVQPTIVNGQMSRWIRARIVSGTFYIKVKPANSGVTLQLPAPPALSKFLITYGWQPPSAQPAQHVLAHNDFSFIEAPGALAQSGVAFSALATLSDQTPALYVGLDAKLPSGRIGLFFDIVEGSADLPGPALTWESWDGVGWRRLTVDDETANLRVPGLVTFFAAGDQQPLDRFGVTLFWLRVRLSADGEPGQPVINGIYLNTVWATQRQTIVNDPIGISTGQPKQVMRFRQFPVLAGEKVEVQELSGVRAENEWRVLVAEVVGDDAVDTFDESLAAEGAQTEFQIGPVRLIRDRRKAVTDVWITWTGVDHFFAAGPNDRFYVIQRTSGRIEFGSGTQGMVPPAAARVSARMYIVGGGSAGNVGAKAITQVLGGAAAIESAGNMIPAGGGADAEMSAALAERGPRTVRHRGRALLPEDYEAMAHEASSAVAVAGALPCRDPAGNLSSGWVTLIIIPATTEERPWPSWGLREEVRLYIEARTSADLAAAHQIHVVGPQYVIVDVTAKIVPAADADAETVDVTARAVIEQFLHPLTGGPDRAGWPLGRDVFLSDVAQALQAVAGVDVIADLALLIGGIPQAVSVRVPEGHSVVTGQVFLTVQLA